MAEGGKARADCLPAELIQTRLERLYGIPRWVPRQDAIDELVACILSQHTSDTNSFRAYARLRQQYRRWEDAMDAPVNELADVIRCGGLADQKAPRIQRVLRSILEAEGSISLSRLADMPDSEARAYLMELPGVGPKTAAIVLCFAMGRPVLPVDTHVFRVAWRTGLIRREIGEAKAHDALQAQIRPERTFRFHVALITHGRQICRALTPRCSECPITDLCAYYRETRAHRPDDSFQAATEEGNRCC